MDELRHQIVNLIRPDLANGVAQLRANPTVDRRAIGDNFHFEENVHPDRQTEFEAFAGDTPGLPGHASDYFTERVQGETQNHIPTSFQPINRAALLAAGFEPNQRLA